MATIDVRQLFNTYAATFATRDADAIVALHPPDTQFWLRDGGQPVQGRAAVRDTVTGALTGQP